MARELASKSIHVAHFVFDGAILPPGTQQLEESLDRFLDPDVIAQTYLSVLNQHGQCVIRNAPTIFIHTAPWWSNFLIWN